MSLKRCPLSTNEFYHVYNKAIADEKIFSDLEYLHRILQTVDFYRYNQRIRLSQFNKSAKPLQYNYLKEVSSSIPLVEIFAFSFMPNHYHFLVKQLQENGVRKFISNTENSFAKYFDLKKNRKGSLFLNSFKYRRITSREEFIHLCRYIHLNPVTSCLIEFKELATYPFCSFSCYLNTNRNKFIKTDYMFNHFRSRNNFIKFHEDQVDYQRKLRKIKKSLID